jgi:hypothetical protein
MQNHTHRLHQKRHRLARPRQLVLLHACKWVGKSYKKLYCIEIITQACLLRCKITHKEITVIIDTSEEGCNAAISSWRDMQNHTQIDLARRSILLVGRRSCCTWSSNKLHFCWRLRDLIPGMTKESFCLATLILVCKSLPQVEGESMVVGKIMRYAPSRFWLLPHLSSEHKRKIQRGWKHIP